MDGSHNDMTPADALPLMASIKPPTLLRRKHKRSSAGKGDCCRTCRLRKVRCAGNPGGGEACTNCARLRLDCSFQDAADPTDALNNISRTTPSQEITEAGTVRKRAQRACAGCHTLKVRCSGDLPRCQRCIDGALVCEYTKTKRRKLAMLLVSGDDSGSKTSTPTGLEHTKESGEEKTTMTAGVPGQVLGTIKATEEKREPCFVDIETLSRGQSLALKDILKQHFDAYMEHLFYLPCLGFLHPASTLQAIEDGTLSAPRAAALCAAASPFLNPARENQDFGARCIDQVELQIWRTMHTFSEEVLVLLALGMVYDFFSGSFAKPWQSIGVGVRLMQGLQLNWDTSQACVSAAKGGKAPTKSFLEQENMRRVAWHLFTFDRVLAGGYDEYITCQRRFMKIRLPCDDQSYLDARAVEAPRLDDMTSKMRSMTGLSGFGIRVMDLRHQIQAYTRTLAAQLSRPQSKREPSSLMSGINGFQNALSQLHAALPLHLRLSEQTIAAHMSCPQRSGYIHFHTHFLVSHIDLYRFALPGFHQKNYRDALMKLPRDFIAKSQRQAISHAICLAKFCEDILKESKASAHRNGSSTTSTSDALKMAGDPTIAHMATQGLRVLLVALQHRLYEGLDLAEHSTVPIWRHETTDWSRIRSLIDSLVKISEPWAEVLVIARHAHASNVAMVEQFDKTNKFTDQAQTINHSAAVLDSGPSKLPGPHYFLDSMHLGAHAEERRARAHDAAAQSWWNKTGRPTSNEDSARQDQVVQATAALSNDLNPWSMPDGMMMEAYRPPGIPIALARARGISFGMSDPNMYTVDDGLQAMQEMMWPMPDLNNMIVDPSQQPGLAAGTGLPFLPPPQGQMGEMLPTTWTSMDPGIPAFFPVPTTSKDDEVYASNPEFAQQRPSDGHYML